jgi:hypothetical protein
MELKLTRKWLTPNSTIGELTVDGQFECFIIEDNYPTPWVKTPGKTAIPAGKYQVIVNMSNRFKVDMPLVLNVPQYQGIRIHPGNTAADTEGCLLPGRIRQTDKVLESKLAYEALFTKIKAAIAKGEKVHIEIVVEPVA